MNISVIDIPHLRKDITSHLSLSNIANCSLVSKTWNAWFTPILWHSINLSSNPINTHERFSTLHQKRIHIRSVIATFNCFGTPQSIALPNLTTLHYTSGRQPFFDLCLILESSPRISSLKLKLSNNNKELQTRLWTALDSLSMLRKLDLSWLRTIDSISIQKILEACSRSVQDLRLMIQNRAPVWEWNMEEANMEPELAKIAGDALLEMQDTQIKRLSIELVNIHQEHSILIPFLRRCPQLIQLNLKSLHSPFTTLPEIVNVFKDKQRMTPLKQLCLGGFSKQSDIESSIVSLLSSVGYEHDTDCNKDRGLRHQYHGQVGGLESLELSSGDSLEHGRILALTHCHSETLTELRFLNPPMNIGKFACLMSGLYKLQTMTTGIWIRDGELTKDEIKTAIERQWACSGLTTFKLSLELSEGSESSVLKGPEDPNWVSSLDGQCVDYIFSQISKLQRLKEWKFICDFDLLCLDNGYLGWMSGLKDLKRMVISQFRLYPYNVSMSTKDGQWMLDNWPSLRCFIYEMGRVPLHKVHAIEDLKSILCSKNIKFGLCD
ncbi:hypothetical protein BGZ76_004449 [Entomortierella beljakovae]|nr:hypothetical protein BGZ76_004449 [Entomortierella beljakovae]